MQDQHHKRTDSRMPKLTPSGEHRMSRADLKLHDISEQDILDAQTFLDGTEYQYDQEDINKLSRLIYRKRLAGMQAGVEQVQEEAQSGSILAMYRKSIMACCESVLMRLKASKRS